MDSQAPAWGQQEVRYQTKAEINLREGTSHGTWNIRTLHQYGKVQFTHELKRYGWDIV